MLRDFVARSLAFASFCFLPACIAPAQAPPQNPAFEVASIKVSAATPGWSTSTSQGQILLRHFPLNECIKMAFGVRDYSLDAPSWLSRAQFDIAAKPPEGAPRSQINQMLQTLLVERFKLTYHREPRLMNVLALIEAPGGIKIREVDNPEGGGGKGSHGTANNGLIWGNQISIAQIADMLSSEIDKPVRDLTGRTTLMDIRLKWTPDTGAPDMTSGQPANDASDPGPSLRTALEVFGLRLQPRKLPIDV